MSKKPALLVENVVFLQGDEADKVFRLMYPEGSAYGSGKAMQNVLECLKEYNNGDSAEWEELDTVGTTGILRTKHYVITWNYPLRWIAFYKRTSLRKLGIKRKRVTIR